MATERLRQRCEVDRDAHGTIMPLPAPRGTARVHGRSVEHRQAHTLTVMTTAGAARPARVHTVLPALHGRGVLLASPLDGERIRQALWSAGFAVVEAHTPPSLREAQAAVAEALRLPEAAGRNLDALVDSLRDLAAWWPEDERVVLLLHGAEALVEQDLPGWHTLTEILQGASADLWRGGVEGDRTFETVALVDRHGVASLGGDHA